MRIEFSDLMRLDFSHNPDMANNDALSYGLLSMVAVVVIMQAALIAWTAHLTPNEIEHLRLT